MSSFLIPQVSNPVPRVSHPDWLHKKLLEKNDVCRQQKISSHFSRVAKPVQQVTKTCFLTLNATYYDCVQEVDENDGGSLTSKKRSLHQTDLEDLGKPSSGAAPSHPPSVTKHRRTLTSSQRQLLRRETWRDVLGPPPTIGTSKVLCHLIT